MTFAEKFPGFKEIDVMTPETISRLIDFGAAHRIVEGKLQFYSFIKDQWVTIAQEIQEIKVHRFDELFPGFHMIGAWTKDEAVGLYNAGHPYLIEGDSDELHFNIAYKEWAKVARRSNTFEKRKCDDCGKMVDSTTLTDVVTADLDGSVCEDCLPKYD